MNVTLCFFFFNDTATTEIYTLSLHDALPISRSIVSPPSRSTSNLPHPGGSASPRLTGASTPQRSHVRAIKDRKSTRLNSSHANISYAVFCLKKKKKYMTEFIFFITAY